VTNKPPVRLNTRVSAETNEWLDRKSEELAISKSSLIAMAVENWRKETEPVKVLPELLEKMKEMGIRI